MKKFIYAPEGVCASAITFWIKNDIVQKTEIEGGCKGNLRAVSILIEGMNISEVIRRMKGIRCGNRPTSCPDQIARGLEKYLQGSRP
jgi:uncharacterized protein (TIGR03905 family)